MYYDIYMFFFVTVELWFCGVVWMGSRLNPGIFRLAIGHFVDQMP